MSEGAGRVDIADVALCKVVAIVSSSVIVIFVLLPKSGLGSPVNRGPGSRGYRAPLFVCVRTYGLRTTLVNCIESQFYVI